MNRRNFIHGLLVGGATFAILPGAGRIGKAERVFRASDFCGKWHFVSEDWMRLWPVSLLPNEPYVEMMMTLETERELDQYVKST